MKMMNEKKKVLVSFSGGETSAFMARWLKSNKSDEYDMVFVFANTGEENEETLEFVDRCDKEFNLGVVWVEAVVHHGERKGCTHRIVNFETASRNGEPFEEIIKKYMIPNKGNMMCTRELKKNPIRSYARSLGWKKKDYYTAIGIRVDEIDRISKHRKRDQLIYPLVSDIPTNKPTINLFWDNMPFRLDLKGYEGNCKTCWKKSFRKLATISKESPEKFDFFRRMESKYEYFISEGKRNNKNLKPPFRFFREEKSVDDIFKIAEDPNFTPASDDSIVYPHQRTLFDDTELDVSNGCIESCEVF
jgi:hypothetical protein